MIETVAQPGPLTLARVQGELLKKKKVQA